MVCWWVLADRTYSSGKSRPPASDWPCATGKSHQSPLFLPSGHEYAGRGSVQPSQLTNTPSYSVESMKLSFGTFVLSSIILAEQNINYK